jgi:hypothetical protein
VHVDDLPNYLEMIGGEDKMMDLATMQTKVDTGEYKSVDQLETDLRTLVTAAQAFNPSGTVPYNSATRLLAHGMKHIDRARPLVLTPSPSPTRQSASESGTPWRGQSTFSGREMTVATEDGGLRRTEILPQSYIPEEMLTFPPNSLAALAVGWNLTGGKRVHAKRIIRGREKFVGKWRNWSHDGTRDIAEMEDVEEVFGDMRMDRGVRRVVDWKGLRKEGEWWDRGGFGGPFGQPPVPFTPYPRKPALRTRELTTSEWGVYPEIEAEMTFISQRTRAENEVEVLSDHLRPSQPKPPRVPPTPNFVNIHEGGGRSAGDWLRDVCSGDARGEAYIRSVESFVKGAMKSGRSRQVTVEENGKDEQGHVQGVDDEAAPLDEYIRERYLGGVLSNSATRVARNTLSDLSDVLSCPSDRPDALLSSSLTYSKLFSMATNAYSRAALRHLARPENPLDIVPFLSKAADFAHVGVGGKTGMEVGMKWVGEEIERIDRLLREELAAKVGAKGKTDAGWDEESYGRGKRKRVAEEDQSSKRPKIEAGSTGSSPLSQPPDSPVPAEKTLPDQTQAMTIERDYLGQEKLPTVEQSLARLRLELVALSKFYPLAALKKMEAGLAERILPPAVRGLMTRK